MPATPVLIIWMKFMSTLLNAPQCRIKLRSNFAKLKVPFRKTNMWPNGLSYIVRSLWKNPPGSLKITTILNNFKHNLKKKSLWFNWKLGFIGLLLVFTYIPNPFIYLFIYLFILFIIHSSTYLFFFCFLLLLYLFTISFTSSHNLFYVIYYASFCYLVMFQTCSYLCYNIII